MNHFLKIIFSFLLLFNAACATIVRGSHDVVTVNSLEKGTTIYVDGQPRGQDNVQADLKRGDDHTIRASKENCQDVTVPVADSFDAITLAGILIDFGILSIPIDLISGAAWKIAPKSYTVSPICK